MLVVNSPAEEIAKWLAIEPDEQLAQWQAFFDDEVLPAIAAELVTSPAAARWCPSSQTMRPRTPSCTNAARRC